MSPLATCGPYTVAAAQDEADRRDVYRLRYRVFVEEWGNRALANADGIERDRVDEACDHLVVRESATGACVGTYRTIDADQARRLGGFFSEGLFELGTFRGLLPDAIETGRACIAREHRNGLTIAALWQGLAAFSGMRGKRWIFGCSSFATAEPEILVPAVRQLARMGRLTASWGIHPHAHRAFVIPSGDGPEAPLPPLIKGYCRAGAMFADQPAWDPVVGSVDFLTVVDLAAMPERYRAWYAGRRDAACTTG